jgi:hypothetical protein
MKTATAALLLAALALPAAVHSGTSDGEIVGAVKIVDNGSTTDRWDIVLLSEGYTKAQLTQFATDAKSFSDYLMTVEPFKSNCRAINVWRIDISSTDSGVDDPAAVVDDPTTPGNETACTGGAGTTARTYFDGTFCSDGVIRRLIAVKQGVAEPILDARIPGWDQAIVVANHTVPGGSGAAIPTTSLGGDWRETAVHEIGHSAFGLADEYEYWAGCGSETNRNTHPPAEPSEPNVTIANTRATIKWADLIAMGTAIPTMSNPDMTCVLCDPRADTAAGAVGIYEGAHYFHCAAYRPVHTCKMRVLGTNFCPVCARVITNTLTPFRPPNQAPSCKIKPVPVAECTGTTSVELDGSESKDAECGTLTYTWTGGFAGGTATGVKPVVQFTGAGEFPVTLTVSDGTLTSSCTTTVKIQDHTPPTLIPPPPITISSCQSPNIGTPTVSDTCGGASWISNAPAKFPLGTTTVTYRARDGAGNTRTAEQRVTAILADDASCCPAGLNVILGTSGSDNIVGTAGADCIVARGGDDVIDARGGNDVVSAGSGRDNVQGGFGNDRIFGRDGDDTIDAGPDNDTIDGGAGIDTCAGSSGTNTITNCEVKSGG